MKSKLHCIQLNCGMRMCIRRIWCYRRYYSIAAQCTCMHILSLFFASHAMHTYYLGTKIRNYYALNWPINIRRQKIKWCFRTSVPPSSKKSYILLIGNIEPTFILLLLKEQRIALNLLIDENNPIKFNNKLSMQIRSPWKQQPFHAKGLKSNIMCPWW